MAVYKAIERCYCGELREVGDTFTWEFDSYEIFGAPAYVELVETEPSGGDHG
jgi:hypothetical protein